MLSWGPSCSPSSCSGVSYRLSSPPSTPLLLQRARSFTGEPQSCRSTSVRSIYVIASSRNSGLLKPGEMCLVLGCPGSGCTTFLKTIANERGSYAGVNGDVRYAGIDNTEMSKHYKGEVVYNGEGQPFSFSGFQDHLLISAFIR